MKLLKSLLLSGLVLSSQIVWAYGGGGSSSTKACAKPKFSEYVPAEKADLKAGGDFAFIASANTYPESIKVTIKDTPVNVNIEDKKGSAFKVFGKLPNNITEGFVRININAEASNKCKGTGGWLVKVSP